MAEGDGELTGGRVNIAGILYQMLVSLSEGLEATITQCTISPDRSIVVLHVEPYDSGDVQVLTRERRIIQIKMKSAHLSWTLGEIIRRVLPDLFRAAQAGASDRFFFVTDNEVGCDVFREFLHWVKAGRGGEGPQPTFAHGRGGKRKPGEQILQVIADGLGLDDSSDSRLVAFLSAFELIHLDQRQLVRTINGHLEVLVEAIEDVRHKRKQLIGELLELGSSGKRVTTSDLLDQAGLDVRRFVHASNLAQRLQATLSNVVSDLGYDAAQDVRHVLPFPQRSLTILRGESGLGKTWRLCATALALASSGRPVVMLRASNSAEALQSAIAKAVWNPVYSVALPLVSIAHRLRSKLADQRGVWLTVFLDDLNDPVLAQQLVDARLQNMGIDLVVSSQPATADWLHQATSADVHDVPPFSYPELAAYLAAHEVDASEIDPDLFELLLKPVFAKLYCLLPRGLITKAESEYELLEKFWEHAVTDRPAHVLHSFDLARLEALVGHLLVGTANYPWSPEAFLPLLDDQCIARLTRSGLIELVGSRQLSMTHDRLLNWALARHIAGLVRDRNLTTAELLTLIRQVDGLTSASGVSIGGRLRYVLMDLIWLLTGDQARTPAQMAEFLLAYMRTPSFDAYNPDFFVRMLASLGGRGIPLLRAFVEYDLSGEKEALWPQWVAAALRKIADVAWDEVREAAVALFRSGDDQRVEVGLRVLQKVGSSELLPELLELTVVRERARVDTDERTIALLHARQRALEAFARSAALEPLWLDQRLRLVTDPLEAEQILWALLRLPRSSSITLWKSHRGHLFEVIPPGKRVLPRAIKVFADPADLERLQIPAPEDAEMYFEATAVAALARLSPRRAIELLETDDRRDTGFDEMGSEGWWMPGLFIRAGGALGAALLARCQRVFGDQAAKELTFLYLGRPELIEPEIVDFLLDELELIACNESLQVEERQQRSYRLLQLLSSLRTPEALERISLRRGTALERGLAEMATQRPPNSARIVDRELEAMAHLLACMGGNGFDTLVLAELASTGVTTREYGYGHAQWTKSHEVGSVLVEHASAITEDTDRTFYLFRALTAHHRDEGLIRLVEANTSISSEAVDIRQAQPGDTSGLVAAIRAKVASEEPSDWVHSVDLSHFVSEDDALALTAPLVGRASAGDTLAERLLTLHFHRGRYEPSLLPKLSPWLATTGELSAYAALHLAVHGDQEARAAALSWLGRADAGPTWRLLQVALALLDHEDTKAGARAYLAALDKRQVHYGHLDIEVLRRLVDEGDVVARERLLSIAFGSGVHDMGAVAKAVEAVLPVDREGAFHAARRLFVNAKQLGAALTLMAVDPERATTELLTTYLSANAEMKTQIGRTLRLKADNGRLASVLSMLANSVREDERQIAAEIGGWLSHRVEAGFLKTLVVDPVEDVAEAAIRSIGKRRAAGHAEELIRLIPTRDKPAQWAMLRALVELVDPHILADREDALAFRALLDSLPEEFRIEANRLIERRIKDVEREIARQVREEDRA